MPPSDDQISRYLADPLSFPPEFKNWVVKYLEQHQPSLLIRQLAGTLLPSKIAGYPGDASKGLDGAGNWTGSMFKIFDSTAPGTVANFDFPTIPATFAHLWIECSLRGDTAATSTTVLLRINNDSTANYQWQQLNVFGATVTGSDSGAALVTAITAGAATANTSPAGAFGSCVIDIPNYAGSNHKAVDAASSLRTAAGVAGYFLLRNAGLWPGSANVSRVTILPGAGNFVQNSRVTVYGLGV